MKIDLTGKTAIVTGSTKGIGYATAQGLADAGATVVVTGRQKTDVDTAIKNISGARGHAVDLGTASGCAALVSAEPSCDILVNNLGIFPTGDVLDLTDDDWELVFQVNVMSGMRLSRAYMPNMMAQGWGRVVFLSSESGQSIPLGAIPYGVSKTALLGLSRGLAKRAAGTGVTVNAISPGGTLTEGFKNAFAQELAKGKDIEQIGREFISAHRPTSIIRRVADVHEVANMIVYVCSMQASATTGAVLRVDGGAVDTIL